MTEWEIITAKFGDPLLDLTSRKAKFNCLIDREHRCVMLGASNPAFEGILEETRMIWLRKFGNIANVMDEKFKFPKSVDEISGEVTPPDAYGMVKEAMILVPNKQSRENIAWLSRGIWKILEDDEIPRGKMDAVCINWSNASDEKFKSQIKQFLNRPKVLEIKEKKAEEIKPEEKTGENTKSAESRNQPDAGVVK